MLFVVVFLLEYRVMISCPGAVIPLRWTGSCSTSFGSKHALDQRPVFFLHVDAPGGTRRVIILKVA